MKVSAINPISFRAKIIDAHAHIGKHEGVIYEKSGLDVFTICLANISVLKGCKSSIEPPPRAIIITSISFIL